MKSCDFLFTILINRYSKNNAEDILLSDLRNRKIVEKNKRCKRFSKRRNITNTPHGVDIFIFNLITVLLQFNH